MNKIVLVISLVIVCGLSLVPDLHAADSAGAPGPSNAVLSQKIDEILKNQKEILKRLEDMKEQLYVIKIRATR